MEHRINNLLSGHKRKFSLNGLKSFMVPEELGGAIHRFLGGRIIWDMPVAMALQLL